MRLVAFCEARSDFLLMSALIDRVLRSHATWISDVLDAAPAALRTWSSDGQGRDFFDIHQIAPMQHGCWLGSPRVTSMESPALRAR